MDNSFENGHYLHTNEHGEEEETKEEPNTHILHAFEVFLLF